MASRASPRPHISNGMRSGTRTLAVCLIGYALTFSCILYSTSIRLNPAFNLPVSPRPKDLQGMKFWSSAPQGVADSKRSDQEKHPEQPAPITPGVPATSNRRLISGFRGCHKINDGENCCEMLDGRVNEEFGYQDCVPAVSVFGSKNKCEPAIWVKNSKHEAAECPAEYKINWDRPPNQPKPRSQPNAAKAVGGRQIAQSLLNGLSKEEICSRSLSGEGFTESWNLCKENDKNPSKCWHNPISGGTYCKLQKLALDKSRINVCKGGEEMKFVMGRAESAEFPDYVKGAFRLPCSEHPEGINRKRDTQIYPHHQKLVMNSLVYGGDISECSPAKITDGVTMLITRYEYANLFHQMTDWYNVFVVASREKILGESITFLFLDGHAKSGLDDAWKAFSAGSGFLRVKHLPTSLTCFQDAFLMPVGYRSPVDIHGMTPQSKGCRANSHISKFRDQTVHVWLQQQHLIPPAGKVKIGIIFRRDYVGHPRSKGIASRKFTNEAEVQNALRGLRGSNWEVELKSMSFETTPFKDQVKAIASQDILIGAHGAGLSFVLWMRPGSQLIEITSGSYAGRYHFMYYAEWAGVGYTSMNMGGGEMINVNTEKLVDLVRPLAERVHSNR